MASPDDFQRGMEEMVNTMRKLLDSLALTDEERRIAEEMSGHLMRYARQVRQEFERDGGDGVEPVRQYSELTEAAALALAFIQRDYGIRLGQSSA